MRIVSSYPVFGAVAIVGVLSVTSMATTIVTVPVGSPGNKTDPATGSVFGAVPYSYNIAKFDVTNAQYAEFLNAKASTSDPYALWNPGMDPNHPQTLGAIYRFGSGPYSYSVIPGYENKPVTYVSWYDAVRFVNWLQNGQGNGDTESGTYTITQGAADFGLVTVPTAAQRATWAATNSFHWVLPSQDEWYKATYYNPISKSYYAYPFQSNSPPSAEAPPGDSNSGAFDRAAQNYDGTGSGLSDVGAYPQSTSPFGSFDMGDDVSQWNDTYTGSSHPTRGGYWFVDPSTSASSYLIVNNPVLESDHVGFRVGSIPEPTSMLLAFIGVVASGIWGCRTVLARRQSRSTSR